MRALWEELESRIQEKYHIAEPEWVQVDVSNKGKIHVTVVTDSNASKEEVRNIVKNAIQEKDENYQIGFIDIYSVEQAEELHIEKQDKVKGYFSWADALYASADSRDNDRDMQIISFYSYKGGVGRTIALIETAYSLAQQGKRVLLMDLDIEAPSLHNIFADQVKNGLRGVEYGIIGYLYRKVVQGEKDLAIDNIYCFLSPENVPGEMILIPALRQMDKEYIYQIGRLQTRKIQEQNVFQEIFDYARRMLDVDVVMIDTRAGFNQWGSLSLLSLSNQIIFVAYPNTENVEGLRAAFEMAGNVGNKRYAVAMSKVVASVDGEEKARRLFGQLGIGQKELIPVYYREEIALSDSYPITSENILSAYRELADYILNNEKIERNREFLSDGKKEQLLKQLFVPDCRMICLFDVFKFQRQRMYVILKYRHAKELYGLDTRIEIHYVKDGKEIKPVWICSMEEPGLESYYASLLAKDADDIEQLGMDLMLETVKKSSVRDQIVLPEESANAEEFFNALQYRETEEMPEGKYGVESRLRRPLQMIVYINITQKMLEGNAKRVFRNINELVRVFNRNSMQFKFLIQDSAWELYQELFGAMKGITLELKVSRDDLEHFMIWNLNHGAFEEYRSYIRLPHAQASAMYKIDGQLIPEREVIETLGLVLGIRKEVREYSSTVLEYLYQFLQSKPELPYVKILDCLKRAAEREAENVDDIYTDRLIGFTNVQRELEGI